MALYPQLSIIIPVAPGDTTWRELLPDLQPVLQEGGEVLLVSPEPPPDRAANTQAVKWIVSASGRAQQMNAGAGHSSRQWLWFLHADSRLDPTTLPALHSIIAGEHEPRLWYFRLEFLADGPALMPITAFGAWLRSRYGGMPFGDQGFLLPRSLFQQVGGYDETAPYGEDHLLAWAVRQHGFPLGWSGGTIRTSARKYRQQGWLRTSTRHGLLTIRQAVPQYLKWRSTQRNSKRSLP